MNLKGKKFENARLGMEINVYEFDEKEWFMSTEVCKLLEHSNPRKAVSDMVWEDEKTTKHIDFIEIEGKNKKINCKRIFITRKGFIELISKTEKLSSKEKEEWFEVLGIEKYISSRKEIEFGSMLIEALKEINLDVIPQYNVDGYRIDFYIPKLNVAVEYDEEQHFIEENIKLDKQRQQYIENKISAKFIRCDYRDSDIKNVMKVVKLCNEEYPNKILDIELFKKLIMDYCSNTYINEIEVIYEDNDFIHIKSFGEDYVVSKTKNFKKLINKSKELQKLSTSYLLVPQEKCSTNYLTRIIIHGLGLEYDGELECETMDIPVLKIIDNASVSYFYYKKDGYYGDGVDFKVDLDNINIKDLKK